MSPPVVFGVLGPVVVRREGRDVALGGPKQRALLAMLLLRANTVVSRGQLIDGLWGERPPPTAGHTLDNYISRLRKLLGDGRLSRRAPGYVLHVESGELDLDRFEQLLERGRAQLAQGDGRAAAESLRSALEIWRGPALADVTHLAFAQGEVERLEERRLLAFEERVDADLSLGCGADVVPELERFVAANPFRERALGQLMLALYRCGRQADALAAFRATRLRFVAELGLEPGPELHDLQQRILRHDPELGIDRQRRLPPERPRRAKPRRLALTAATALAVVVSTTVGVVVGAGGSDATTVSAGAHHLVSLSVAAPTDQRTVALPVAATAMTTGYGALWLAAPSAGSVSRIDLRRPGITDSIPVGGEPGLLAVGGGSVWIAGALGDSVLRVDPVNGAVVQTVPLGATRAAALAFGAGRLWIADGVENSLIAVDPDSGRIERTLPLDVRPSHLAADRGVMWVADYGGGSVTEVDLRSGQELATIHVGGGPAAVAVGHGVVWVANALDSTVAKVDPRRGSVVGVIPVGSGPAALAVAGGSVWVANEYSRTVSRIDAARGVVTDIVAVGGGPAALAAAGGRVWVGVHALARHRGGTLRLLSTQPLSIDPAVNGNAPPLMSDALVRDGLVTYARASGSAGTQLVPDLALSIPTATDGGTTYTFRLRRGIVYSDGRPVRASDFRRALERMFRMRSPYAAGFTGVLGAQACTATECDLSTGVVADDAAHTVTLRLGARDPDFLAMLAVPPAAPVPPGTPLHDAGSRPIPGTGPYMVAAASTREVRYVRNPRFREWSHAAQPDGDPDEIVWRFGLSPEQEVRAVEIGEADYSLDDIPAALLPRLRTRYANRLHRFTIPTTAFIQVNTTQAPFDDVRVRRALNLALDRREVVRRYGGADLATPTCQILPPGIVGHRRYCPYTRDPGSAGAWSAPDLARARRLVAASGTRGQRVTLWGWTDDAAPQVAPYYVDVLRQLGYRARLKLVSHAHVADAPASVLAQIHLIMGGWGGVPADDFFRTWFSCDGPNVHGWFCDRRLDRWMRRAQALKATRPRAAAALWARIDRVLVDRAAWVPTVNEHYLGFVSDRVKGDASHPVWGLNASQVRLGPQQP